MNRAFMLVVVVTARILPLYGEGPSQQLSQASSTQRINFALGGVIRFQSSYGDLYIEGWDQPQVEIKVIKSTHYFKLDLEARNAGRLETVNVAAELRSDKELVISTLLLKHKTNGVTMEYRIRVPRQSQLIIHHRGGSVTVGNVSSDVDASNREGDIMLMLPEKASYAIDARSKMGHIASDFEGRTLSRYVVGQRFIATGSSASAHINLRVGFGGVTILALPPEGAGLASASSEYSILE